MTVGADYGVGMDQDRPERPQDIRTAYELWCAVAVLGVLAAIALALTTLGMREQFDEEIARRMAETGQDGTLTDSQIQLAFTIGIVFVGVLGLAAAGLVFLLARKLRAGRGWARLVLTGATAFVVVSVLSSFAGGGPSGAAPMALEIIMILQAVLAVGATVLAHRREAGAYLAKRPRR